MTCGTLVRMLSVVCPTFPTPPLSPNHSSTASVQGGVFGSVGKASTVAHNCTFTDNTAATGGGVAALDTSASFSVLSVASFKCR